MAHEKGIISAAVFLFCILRHRWCHHKWANCAPLCFSSPLLSQTISTLFTDASLSDERIFFSSESISDELLRICGGSDEQCLQKMCFPDDGLFTTGCQISNTKLAYGMKVVVNPFWICKVFLSPSEVNHFRTKFMKRRVQPSSSLLYDIG